VSSLEKPILSDSNSHSSNSIQIGLVEEEVFSGIDQSEVDLSCFVAVHIGA
jgi:hypothetical protein